MKVKARFLEGVASWCRQPFENGSRQVYWQGSGGRNGKVNNTKNPFDEEFRRDIGA
jgi:hypothetical protein